MLPLDSVVINFNCKLIIDYEKGNSTQSGHLADMP